jgi:alpha-L-fucosidase
MLLDIGRWLSVNGEAIYSTRPWKVYGEGVTEIVEGSFQDTKRQSYTARDVRFTTKGETLYAIALGFPQGGVIEIQSLGTRGDLYPASIERVQLLGMDAAVEWTRSDDSLRVTLPVQTDPEQAAYVLKIE